jgi:uncharacterized damage-inducible protein DinB
MHAMDILKYGHLTVAGTIEQVPESEWESPDVCGWWSTKDIIAHLASFEQALVELLNQILGKEGSTPTLDSFSKSPQEFNDIQVAQRQEKTPAEVWAEYVETQAQTMALLAQIPVTRQRQMGLLSWYGPEYDLEDFLVYSFYGHKREHMAQVAIFLDLLAQQGKIVRENG